MICKNCGKEVSIKEPRCPFCGTVIQIPDNGFAIAGLILSLIPPLFGILAIIFSTLGLKRAKQCDGKNKSIAIAGLTIGILKLSFAVLLLSSYFILIILQIL